MFMVDVFKSAPGLLNLFEFSFANFLFLVYKKITPQYGVINLQNLFTNSPSDDNHRRKSFDDSRSNNRKGRNKYPVRF